MKIRRAFKPLLLLVLAMFTTACQDFFDPNPDIVVDEEDFFQNFDDFRTAELGLYTIQQDLAEQLVILGELRADLLEPTKNADAELLEISNLNISINNEYISPVNFYKLIANCNNLIRKIKEVKPSVANPLSLDNIDNFDRLYGSVIAMRAWAYFNAVRIYGNIPYVYPELTTVNQIADYINTGQVVIDKRDIKFDANGYTTNDTTYNDTVKFDRIFLNMEAVVDTFTYELETKIKRKTQSNETTIYIGVDYNLSGVNDNMWEITTWNQYAYHVLLGQMYFTVGDLVQAEMHFHNIVYFTSSIGQRNRYLLANNISNGAGWKNFYSGMNLFEHILVMDFSKVNRQQNSFQRMFSPVGNNHYTIKPTSNAVHLWEGDQWSGWSANQKGTSEDVSDDFIRYDGSGYITSGAGRSGTPGDYGRGNKASYAYYKNGEFLSDSEVKDLLLLKYLRKDKEVASIMNNVDTVAYKFFVDKEDVATSFDRDCDFIVYSAPMVHLYMAELLGRLADITSPLGAATYRHIAIQILSDGSYNHDGNCRGVRGRVGFGNNEDVEPKNALYFIDPNTAEIIKAVSLTNAAAKKSIWFDHVVMKERAKELAFQGDRFYDLIRVSERQGKKDFYNLLTVDEFYRGKQCYYIALVISQKFEGSERERIFNYLNEPANWYITPEWDFSLN